ncbi:Hypothetical predicted protein [Mytilus galloprovincialis]|uniref:C-terminal of Roc (COR) domain-containing protein n=1 Tax=Mytilus galloprovincialis TaxID=29158 RepID=A0A8B6DMW4_MYTGA|nr:Hypothetical predicted protein [Mytilus galloprovincialis]
MSKLAKHPDINILKEGDLLLFLRFQHNVGNIIFFEKIPDLIILNPQWLADAFRCLVSDRIDTRELHHLDDWCLFTQRGKISDSLITKLFESKAGSQFSGMKDNLHKVMDKLDIIVKIENSSYYIMPSMMPSSTFDDHKQMHRSDQICSPWMNNEVKEIPDRAKINTTQDDQNPENEPNKEEAQDQTPVNNNLPVSVNLRQQINIRQSTNKKSFISSCKKIGNTLVFTDFYNKRLIICNSDGTDKHHIPLSYKPWYITEIDSNTVAVACLYDSTILIINISTRSITSTIKTIGNCYGISYNDNNLYVVIDRSIIHVMDLTGKVIRTIPVPTDDFYDITVDRDRLVYIDKTSIYCCSLDGKVIWQFKMDVFQDLTCVTTDNEGNVYVTNESTNTVIVVSDDGKHHKELLTKSDGLNKPREIYFDKKENVLLVCNVTDGNAFLFDVIKKLT